MEKQADIMKYESVLPEDFDGTFRFTNATTEDFVAKWGNREYVFPAGTTSPIVMTNHTPLEIQNIRKKWAKDLAEKEFFRSRQYETIRSREGAIDDMGMIQPRSQGMSHAGTYSMDQLTPLIQKCLVPLEASKASIRIVTETPLEEKLSRDNGGELNTIVVEQGGDLIEEKRSLKRKALG